MEKKRTKEEAPPPARGRPRSDAIHSELLWAATRMFSRRGRLGTSTREIAAEAGTTERTLFKHFGSKEGLLHAVLDEAVLAQLAPASLAELKRAIQAYAGDFQAWHQALLLSRLEALRAAPELTRLLIIELVGDEAQRARFVAQWKEAAWAPLVALFGQLQRDGSLRTDLATEPLVAQFLRSNMGFLVGRLLAGSSTQAQDREDVAALASLFSAGAAAPPSQLRVPVHKVGATDVR
jgi:AcrR family transcriptional regulator